MIEQLLTRIGAATSGGRREKVVDATANDS